MLCRGRDIISIPTPAPVGKTSFTGPVRTDRTSSAFEFFIICSISVKIIAHVYNDDSSGISRS